MKPRLFGSCPRHFTPARPSWSGRAFLRGILPLAGLGTWRNSRRTRCNLNVGSGFCRFMRLRAAGCGRLRSRILRRTLSGSPAPRPHQPKGSNHHHPRHPQSGGRWTSGSAALPPSMSVPATWQAESCRSPGRAMRSQIGTGSGGRIWGLFKGLSWGPSGTGRGATGGERVAVGEKQAGGQSSHTRHHFTIPRITLKPPTSVEPPYSLAKRRRVL